MYKPVKLPYDYSALEPFIDTETMKVHYNTLYMNYIKNLNAEMQKKNYRSVPIKKLIATIDNYSDYIRNNAGGYYNHSLFFECIGPKSGSQPKDTLAMAINRDFGSLDGFKNQFKNAANNLFGSGWAWLIVDNSGKLKVTTTPNQDNPLMPKAEVHGKPILALDVWEHAYYLEYQNSRKNYIDAFFKIINWKIVGEKYEEALKKD